MEATLHNKPLLGARVSFTGRLATISHDDAKFLVADLGGRYSPAISRQTTMLVVGMAGWPLGEDGGVSRKLQQAEEANRRGSQIQILSESAFFRQIGKSGSGACANKSYAADSISQITGLSSDQIRHLEGLGLVESRDGLYDYQDLVSLQAISNLLNHGVRPERIAGSLHRLREVMPAIERPLSQLRVIAESPKSLLLELDGTLRTIGGQLAFDFESRSEGGRLMSSPGPVLRPDWLARGEELEDQERYKEAEAAYRRAIAESAEHSAEAWFNLGNVLRALDRTAEAEGAFARASNEDRSMACAFYNLADLQEEREDLDAAITSLRSAIRADPGMADAYYNLALCLDQLGRRVDAAKSFRAYLRLDPVSEWADAARDRLAEIR